MKASKFIVEFKMNQQQKEINESINKSISVALSVAKGRILKLYPLKPKEIKVTYTKL